MNLRVKLIYLAIFIFSNMNAQKDNQKKIDLSSSLNSFEALSNLLAERDTVNLKFVITKKAWNSFNFKALNSLEELGKEWRNKKAIIIKQTESEEIIKIEDYYIPLVFIRENDKEWKFSTFKINN